MWIDGLFYSTISIYRQWRMSKTNKTDKNYYNFSTLSFFFSLKKKQACSHQGQGKRKDLQQKIVVYEWTIRQTFCFKLVIALWHFVRGTSENGDIKKQKHFTLSTMSPSPSVNSRQHQHIFLMIFKWLTRSCKFSSLATYVHRSRHWIADYT